MKRSGRQAGREPDHKHPAWETNERNWETNEKKWETSQPGTRPDHPAPRRPFFKVLRTPNSKLFGEQVLGGKRISKEAGHIKIPSFPQPESYRDWKIRVRDAVRAASSKPDKAFSWINKVWTEGQTIEGLASAEGFTTLDAKLLAALSSIGIGEFPRKVNTFKEQESMKDAGEAGTAANTSPQRSQPDYSASPATTPPSTHEALPPQTAAARAPSETRHPESPSEPPIGSYFI